MLQPSDTPFPLPLSAYPEPLAGGLVEILLGRIVASPFNAVASAIFLLAVLHTFFAARFTEAAHQVQKRHSEEAAAAGIAASPSVAAELLHFLGEVEVVFGLWVVPLVLAITVARGWATATHYLSEGVEFTDHCSSS